MQIVADTPQGWDIYEFPGRNQPFTLLRERLVAHTYDKQVGGFWRNRETISFHATEREAWGRLKAMTS